MKLLKLALILLLVTGCANTDDVDDSDVQNDIASGSGQSVDDEESSSSEEDGEVADTASATPTPTKHNGKGPYEARGDAANLLYNIASAALKKSDTKLSYSVKCTYIVKPLSIKGCMVKTGFLPADAKNKVGKLLLEAKNLPRKKGNANEAVVATNYSCTKGKTPSDTTCTLEKVP